MNNRLKRGLTGVVVAMLAAVTLPFLTATPASAAGVLQGAATINTAGGGALLQSGDGATNWTLRLPSGASCPGDSPNDGWRWQTYMVPSSVDPSTLQFGGSGPNPPGTGASFRQPLFDTFGSPVVNQNTPAAATSGGPGPIVSIPDVNFEVFSPGQIPAGVYNIGIACTLGPASATQMSNFWNVQMTIAENAGGADNADITWQNGTAPAAPTITTLTPAAVIPATGQVSVAFTNPAANPALTSCTVTVGTTAGGSQYSGPGTGSGPCTSPRVVTGLTYGTPYFFRMTSTNSVGTSPVSNELSATVVRPAVANLTATPSPNTITLNWDDQSLKAAGEDYNIDICTLPATSPCLPASSGHVAPTPSATSTTSDYTFTGVAGQAYAFTVTYGPAGSSFGSSVSSVPLSNAILLQDITVGRPNGALVLTQVCGRWDEMAAEAGPQLGFPTGLPLSAAQNTPSAPTTGAAAGGPPEVAAKYNQYPYPENADGTANPSYPTHCGIALGNARLVTQGTPATTGAGQFFAASGRLNQVTIVDTRDTDPGWTINFTMGSLSNGTDTLSGNQLGWTAQRTDSPAFQDGNGFTYDQVVNYVNQQLAPNGQGAAGAGTAHGVITAPNATPGLGIATLDARLKLLIPIHAKNGNYAGTLTINAV